MSQVNSWQVISNYLNADTSDDVEDDNDADAATRKVSISIVSIIWVFRIFEEPKLFSTFLTIFFIVLFIFSLSFLI